MASDGLIDGQIEDNIEPAATDRTTVLEDIAIVDKDDIFDDNSEHHGNMLSQEMSTGEHYAFVISLFRSFRSINNFLQLFMASYLRWTYWWRQMNKKPTRRNVHH